MSLLQENIREKLLQYLDPEVRTVLEVGQYIISSGGKHVRPAVLIYTAQMFTSDIDTALPLAVGVEYVHTASLLHDDVVDDAKTRRGKPSAHTVFGNQVCILTGDYMYAKALSLYATYGSLESIRVLSRAVMEMAQAQVLELKSVGDLISEETYYSIVDGKTGALFGACMAVGALVGGREDYMDFYRMGVLAGRAFQMMDDALDYTGSEKRVGKPVGNDLREGKCTYPLISVLDRLDVEEAKRRLRSGDVEELRQRVIELGGVDATVRKAREYVEEVKSFLMNFDNSEDLLSLIDFLVNRES